MIDCQDLLPPTWPSRSAMTRSTASGVLPAESEMIVTLLRSSSIITKS
jgi:hypothetical protein